MGWGRRRGAGAQGWRRRGSGGSPGPSSDLLATSLAASSSCTSGWPRSVPSTAPCMRGWCCRRTWGPGSTGHGCWSRSRSGAIPKVGDASRSWKSHPAAITGQPRTAFRQGLMRAWTWGQLAIWEGSGQRRQCSQGRLPAGGRARLGWGEVVRRGHSREKEETWRKPGVRWEVGFSGQVGRTRSRAP